MVLAAFGYANAQTNLTSHFEWALTNPQNPQIGVYTLGAGNGYLSGNNSTGATAQVQLFDSQTGITGAGSINSIKMHVAVKNDNGGSFNMKVWANNGGALGAELASQSFTLASVDTTQAGMSLIMTQAGGIGGIYNVEATFTTPISFTSSGFWVGFTIPTTAGDTVVALTTLDNSTSYTLANTHTGLVVSNNFASYGSNNIHCALAVFASVTFGGSTVAVEETLGINNTVAYPNPAINEINFQLNNNNVASIELFDINGRLIASQSVKNSTVTFDTENFNAG